MGSAYLTEILTCEGKDKVTLNIAVQKVEINHFWKKFDISTESTQKKESLEMKLHVTESKTVWLLLVLGDLSTDVGLKTKQIIQKANVLKTFVKTTFVEGRINLEQLLNNNTNLTLEAIDLNEKISKLQDDINSAIKTELSNCLRELGELSRSLQEINITLMFIFQLSEMHSLLSRADNKLLNKEYYECAKLIKDFQNLMKNDTTDLNNIELYKSLSDEGVKCYEKLLQEINALWASYVQFDTEILKEIKILKLHIKLEFIDVITDILKASDCLEYVSFENDFIHNFLTNIVNEIIMYKVIIRELTYGNKVLNLEILHTAKKPNYEEVFANLKKVLEFLAKYLNMEIRDNFTYLNKVGTQIGIPLINSLIKNYLVKIIPKTTVELENYYKIMISAEDFDTYLKENGFLPQDSTSISDHKRTINDLFLDRFYVTHLEKARLIMKMDLNETLYSDDIVITALDKLPQNCSDILKNKFNIKGSTYVYSKTQISKLSREVTQLVREIMLEAMRSKDSFSVAILNTIQNVFEIYSTLLPMHHKKLLETIPLQAGLFHNSCLYFAYYLINLVSEFYERVSPTLSAHFHKLLEIAASIRSLAKEKLEEHVTAQKDNLIYIIQNSGLVNLQQDAQLSLRTQGSVRQCMRQLQLLENNWKDLLPSKVYHRAMGFLLDSVIDEFISLIMAVEDIPCTTATNLAAMFGVVLEKAPPLFLDPKEVFKHSAKWLKLNEFVLVLKGGLKDVDERWSDGLGPLANEFTPEQVKHLVRALFQNSDRRSELLNRIK